MHKLGILMLDTRFPRIPGDIGNEKTFKYPIVKKIIEGASPQKVVLEGDRALLPDFIEGAKQLESEGVSAITTSCGFLAMFQKEIAEAVKIPVFTSSLLQVSIVSAMLPQDKIVGILTADSTKLSQKHFDGVGISHVSKVVYGMEGTAFGSVFVGNGDTLDKDLAEREMLAVAKKMMEEHPNVGAIVFECTNMPPYAKAISQQTGLPVYDISTLSDNVMNSLYRKEF